MTKCKLMKGLLGATALTVISTGTAFAQNDFTPAGELVSNTFTLDYEVNNTAQTQITNTATPTVFNVDRLVNVTVSSSGNTLTIPEQEDVLLPFVVVNNGNDTHAYLLGFEQGGSDDFDSTTATTLPEIIFYDESADTNNDGALSEAERLAATPQNYSPTGTVNIPELAPDERAFVFVRQNIPAGGAAADEADILFYANTQTIDSGTGATLVYSETLGDTNGNDADATEVENVLADQDGPAVTNDAPTDGAHSALGSYILELPDVTATKEVFGVAAGAPGTCDAIPSPYVETATNTEYFTPNSCVEYIIKVVNAGSTNATNIDLSDILPDHLTFREAVVAGDLNFLPADLTAPAAATACDGTATCTVSLVDATLDAGDTGYLVIRATID